jgi:hypothetical protein
VLVLYILVRFQLIPILRTVFGSDESGPLLMFGPDDYLREQCFCGSSLARNALWVGGQWRNKGQSETFCLARLRAGAFESQ